ncbi:tetratricopeptide repeat protein [Gammaproteobacteria bacterium]|nr:tetratricopeptide repeat protein [Gammaproteobacteria bacterium]
MKFTCILLFVILALGSVSGCSSPEEKAASHLANAELLLAKGALQKARIEYANVLQLNQNMPQAWFGLARIHQQRQQWDKAYNILVTIRDSNPRYMDARILLTKLLLAANQLDQASEDARDIVELSPDDARAHAIMASVQFRLGDVEAAWQSIERALTLDPVSEEALLMQVTLLIEEKKYKQSLEILDTALQTKPGKVSFYLMKLTVYNKLGDEAAVEQTYKSLIKNFPEKAEFRDALVRRFIGTGNIDQAELLLQHRVEENPDNIDAKIRLVIFSSQHRTLESSITLLKTYIEEDEDEYQFKFVLGELYMRNKQMDPAIAVYRGIIDDEELAPDGLEARNRIARIYLLSGKLAESRALVDEVLAQDKNNQDALLIRARFNLAERKYDATIVNLRTVLRDNPDSIEALELIGRAHEVMGADNLAIESLNTAFELNPGSVDIGNRLATILIRTRQPDQADAILLQSIDAGNQSVEALRLLIQVKMTLGQWEEAEQLAQRLKTFEGQASASQHVLGLVYQNRDQRDESIVAFKQAYDLDPDVSDPVIALVKVYLDNNEPEKAREFLLSVVAENPANTMAYQLLGQLSLRKKDIPAATRYFEQAIEANPRVDTGYLRLAAIYLAENQLHKAENIFEKGLLELPNNLELSMNLALVVERQGDFERAIELYEGLLQKNPDIIVARNNLASLLIDYRDDAASHDRARDLAAEFRDSKVPVFRDTYAWTSVRSGLYLEEAALILQSIVRENEGVGIFHYHLGEAYRKTGSSFDSRKHLRRAVELERPGSPIAIEAQKALDRVTQ